MQEELNYTELNTNGAANKVNKDEGLPVQLTTKNQPKNPSHSSVEVGKVKLNPLLGGKAKNKGKNFKRSGDEDEMSFSSWSSAAPDSPVSDPLSMVVMVPPGAQPNSVLTIRDRSGRLVKVRLPPGSYPAGSRMTLKLPPKNQPAPKQKQTKQKKRGFFSFLSRSRPRPPPPVNMMSVTVPRGAKPGTRLTVAAPDGRKVMTVVPAGCRPGSKFKVKLAPKSEAAKIMRVKIPLGVQQGQSLIVRTPTGDKLVVAVPKGARAGMSIHVKLANQTPDLPFATITKLQFPPSPEDVYTPPQLSMPPTPPRVEEIPDAPASAGG